MNGDREDIASTLLFSETYEHGRARCRTPVSRKDMYGKLSAFGYGFGPCFRTMSDVHYGDDGEAISIIKTQDWITKVPPSSVAKHVIHPTALDGIIHTILPGLSMGGKSRIPTLVPTRIHKMWVSNVLLHQAGSSDIKIYSKSGTSGLRVAKSNIVALDAVQDEARVVIKGLQMTAVADISLPSSDILLPKRICYNLDLRPDLDFLNNEEIVEYCWKSSGSLAADRNDAVEEVELACFLAISNTLRTITQNMLPKSKPHLLKYLAWGKHQLDRYDSGNLVHGRPEWKDLACNPEYQKSLFEKVGIRNPEGRLCVAVANQLSRILTGEVDALEYLFSGTLMDEYYHWSIEHANGFTKTAAYLDALVHKDPSLKILEIGAGTGSGTASVVEVLTRHGEGEYGAARYGHFTFTDISPSFFEKARERFASQIARMTFKVLDISSDPAQQDFEEGSYDLIVAVNVS